jgi:hypothetical protein
LLDLVHRHRHLDAQILHFLTARNDAAVIVAEHGHWPINQVRPEHTLARDIEIVAVDQGEERRHHSG